MRAADDAASPPGPAGATAPGGDPSGAATDLARRLRRANQALRAVGRIHEAQQSAPDVRAFFDAACREIAAAGQLALAWVGLAEPGPGHRVTPIARHGAAAAYVDEVHVTYDDAPTGLGPAGHAIRTGAPVTVQRTATDPRFAPWREVALRHALASVVALPLAVDGEVVGALALYASEPDAFDDDRIDALGDVARAVAAGYGALLARMERRRADARRSEAEDDARRAHAESEARLHRVLDGGWDVVTLSDERHAVRYVSGSVRRVLGYTVEEYCALRLDEAIHPDDLAAMRDDMAAFFAEPGATRSTTHRLRHRDGRWVWLEVASTNLLHDPSVRAIVSSARDVTARKRAEEDLQRLNAELEARVARRTTELAALYEHAPCGYHSIDAAGLVVRMNETELRWLGRAREDVVGARTFEELVAPEHRDALRGALAGLGPAPAVAEIEVELARADQTRFWVLLSASRDADHPGTTRMTAFDLTARRAAEKAVREREDAAHHSRDELSAANAALQRAAIAKDEFLASMSHELRTPLNAILGLSEAFQDEIYGPVGAPQLRALKRIEESGRHLLSLINDILDLSKVEAGQLALDLQPTSLDDVCRASLRMVQEAAQKKRIGVSYSIDDGLAILLADERSLKQILVNLLSNAVKFTREDGSIGLEVTTSPDDDTCTFSVWDTGIGIAATSQGRLFRPFVQLDSSLARHHAGTGLGLALVRRLVELHGGGIRVESAPDAGSRFTVVIPWHRAAREDGPPRAAGPAAPRPRPAVPRARVLLAEDDATNVALVSDFFDAHGVDLTVARNGYEAVSLAQEKVPDLILMDIQMPLLDGIAALRAIRQSSSPEVRRIPVIAVTALAMPGDRERCQEAGADDYLTKPLRLHRLLEVIDAHVPAPGTPR